MKSLALFITLCFGYVLPASAAQTLRWERLPLAVTLVVGQERAILLDRDVRVGVPDELGDRLRVLSAAGAVYLRASKPFKATRLQLQEVDGRALILLDITAIPATAGQSPLEPVRIILDGEHEASNAHSAAGWTTSERPATDRTPASTPIAVVLTRYAAQSLYAPLRTIEHVPGLVRVPLRRDLPLDSLLPTLALRARALAAWRLEDEWVTAVQLTNLSNEDVELDPRTLQGDFLTATFQHHTLGPAHEPRDTTVLYLVTRSHGLAESLLPAISPIDASRNLATSRRRHGARP